MYLQFKDLTTLPVVFELHTVLCSVPASSLWADEIAAVSMVFLLKALCLWQLISTVRKGFSLLRMKPNIEICFNVNNIFFSN